jgi:hypothetical protein
VPILLLAHLSSWYAAFAAVAAADASCAVLKLPTTTIFPLHLMVAFHLFLLLGAAPKGLPSLDFLPRFFLALSA